MQVFAESWSPANESVIYGVSHDEQFLPMLYAAKQELERTLLVDVPFDAQALTKARAKGIQPLGNIVGVGIGEKETDGRPTGQLALRVYVEKKVEEKKGEAFTIASDARIPPAIKGVRTDVIEIGVIEAFDRTREAQAEAYVDRQRYPRPVPGGVSVGHPSVTAGTLGCMVYDQQSLYILSNNHVLANSNGAQIGDPIIHPASADGGTDPQHRIATLSDFTAIKMGGPANSVDCAIAWVTPNVVRPEILQIGLPDQIVDEPRRGVAVMKRGRSSGLTTNGIVDDIHFTVRVSYREAGWAIFTDQVLIRGEGFSQGGDSGSLIIDRASNRPLGLLFSGNAESGTTVANRLTEVLQAMRVSIW